MTTENEENADKIIKNIQDELRHCLPVDAISDTERIVFPTSGPNADCDSSTTVHVDAFLFEEDIIDQLVDEGRLSRNYCTKCGSREVKPLTFITHSASASQVKYIFKHLLPNLTGKMLVDIGSRTGAMLYGAHLYSCCKYVVGVEIDEPFCNLQSQIVAKYNMQDRIQIIHGNIMNQQEILKCSQVIILNNVFDFFLSEDEQAKVWHFLYDTVKEKGTLLVTNPSLSEALHHLKISIDLASWVEEQDATLALSEASKHLPDIDDEELTCFHLYKVL
ncbi:uncharacterized protein LOC121370677 isoform X2 [Gigantopelta aegis]|nr:uncharacterized protein LOC121370677 isoform X2 [Gigantopelta aegis]XP_041352006.1 uncharacterized protein LOC121370677 isoform X2 [Gigantopelta aegis]XP_041352007.1 uncharacterized protein LOC121370677 isoform X2 [Gigantopelta aegis]